MELDEPTAQMSVERWAEELGRELREYRFRLNTKRRALIRDALTGLIDEVDADIRTLRHKTGIGYREGVVLPKQAFAERLLGLDPIHCLDPGASSRPNCDGPI